MTHVRSETAEASITRLLWREQIRAFPAAVRAAVRRLLRREPRWYLVVDEHVVARLVSRQDYDTLMAWIAHVHTETFHTGVQFGRGAERAVNRINQGNTGDASTS